MRLHELRGLPVVDPVSARTIGTVCDVRLDAVGGRLAALEVAHDFGPSLVPGRVVRRVGSHAVMLTGEPWQELPVASAPEGWLDTGAFLTLSVLDQDGSLVGRLADAQIDRDTLGVRGYTLRAPLLPRLLGRPGRPLALPVLSCSRQVMVVGGSRDDTLARLKPEDRPDTAAAAVAPKTSVASAENGSIAELGGR